MRILAFEYITGGGLAGAPLPGSLVREGELMLRALLAELAALPGVELVVPRDPRLSAAGLQGRVVRPNPARSLDAQWAEWVAEVDAVWPVAPESGGVLEALSRAVTEAGRTLLGSRPEAVRVAASKSATAFRLGALGLPVVPTRPVVPGELPGDSPWVVKPDDGVGCEETRLFHRAGELERWVRNREDGGRFVVQPYRSGTPASLSLLCADGCARLLTVNRQRVVEQGSTFRLVGIEVNGLRRHPGPWQALAAGVARALPELWGYVGVDLLLTPEGPEILEVNPRLTSSYAGVGAALGLNVAGAVLALARGEALPEIRSGGVVNLMLEESRVA